MYKKKKQSFCDLYLDHRSMHWSRILACAMFMSSPLLGNTQQVSLHYVNSPLKNVLKDIKKQTGYDFLYNDKIVNENVKISVSQDNSNIEEILDESLKNTNLTYTIKDKMVLINSGRKEKDIERNLYNSSKNNQEYILKGVIKTANGEGLAGATIRIKNTSNESMSREGGVFEIPFSSSIAEVEVSLLGYKTVQRSIEANRFTEIRLEELISEMDEVVVVGYGTQKRSHLTAAVSQVSAEELTKAPMQNLSNMLTGKLPGLTSIQSTGKPGADGTALYVRGLNSFAGGNGPMILVDGIPRLMDYVNPNDVESVSVLKDAAAAITVFRELMA